MTQHIYRKGSKAIYVNEMENVEGANYIDTVRHFHIQSMYPPILDYLRRKFFIKKPDLLLQSLAMSYAVESTKKKFQEIANITIPESFVKIFTADLKEKEKNRLLRDSSISLDVLSAIFFMATKLGYKFTYYKYEGEPKAYNKGDLPYLIHMKDNGEIEKVGDTNLTDNQLKDLIESSNYLIARIFDNGTYWHCFLQTKRGLTGKEPGRNGTHKHIHYISDKFGLSKEELINDYLKKGRYPTIKNHIKITD